MDDLQFGAHDKRGSHILSLVRRQLPEDWTERYNTTPVLIETFVETERFTGAVYKASASPNFCRQSPAGIRTSLNESADDTLTQIVTNRLIRAVTKKKTQQIQCQRDAIADEPRIGEASGPRSVAGNTAEVRIVRSARGWTRDALHGFPALSAGQRRADHDLGEKCGLSGALGWRTAHPFPTRLSRQFHAVRA